tara:strand:+ start:207 stop:599 length:393 start_codon:yes stop_codon:yes gene_type:complete
MNLAISVYGSNQTHQASLSALRFARAAVAKGHQVSRVFFYQDGVYNGNGFATPPQDEEDVVDGWREFARANESELMVCVASTLRRGVIDEAEAERYEKTGSNLTKPFQIAGLGQLIDSALEADRLVTFGA